MNKKLQIILGLLILLSAVLASNGWERGTTVYDAGASYNTQVVQQSDGRIWVAYTSVADDKVEVANTTDGGVTWTKSIPDANFGYMGEPHSMAVDSNDNIWLCKHNDGGVGGDLEVLYWNQSTKSWSSHVVASANNVGQQCKIYVNSTDDPLVVGGYSDSDQDMVMWYGNADDVTDWSAEIELFPNFMAGGGINYLGYTDGDIDSNDVFHFVGYNNSNGYLLYANVTEGTRSSIAILNTTTNAFMRNALLVNSTGDIHIFGAGTYVGYTSMFHKTIYDGWGTITDDTYAISATGGTACVAAVAQDDGDMIVTWGASFFEWNSSGAPAYTTSISTGQTDNFQGALALNATGDGVLLTEDSADGASDYIWNYSMGPDAGAPAGNAAPVCDVTSDPASSGTRPDASDDIVAKVRVNDTDAGDTLSADLSVYLNGVNQTTLHRNNASITNGTITDMLTILSGNFSKGDYVSFNVTAGDGTDTATCEYGFPIRNAAPVISDVTLEMAGVGGGSPTVYANVTVTDPDGAEVDSCFWENVSGDFNITAFTANPIRLKLDTITPGTLISIDCNDTSNRVAGGVVAVAHIFPHDFANNVTGSLATQYVQRTYNISSLGYASDFNYSITFAEGVVTDGSCSTCTFTGDFDADDVDGNVTRTPVWSGDWVTKDSQVWAQDLGGTRTLAQIDLNDTAYTISNNNTQSSVTINWDVTGDSISGVGTCTGAAWDTGSGAGLTIAASGSQDVTLEAHADCFDKEGAYTWTQNTTKTRSLAEINWYDTDYLLTNYFGSALTVDWDISGDGQSLGSCTGGAWDTASGTVSVTGGGGTQGVKVEAHADCFAAELDPEWPTQNSTATNTADVQYFQNTTYTLDNLAGATVTVDWDISGASIANQMASCSGTAWNVSSGTDSVPSADLNVTVSASGDCITFTDAGWTEDTSHSHTLDEQQIMNNRTYDDVNATIDLNIEDSISAPALWDGSACSHCTNSSIDALASDVTWEKWWDIGDVITNPQTNNTQPAGSTLTITYGVAEANVTGGPYNITTNATNTGGYNFTSVNIMPDLPDGWWYVNSTVSKALNTNVSSNDTINVYADTPYISNLNVVVEHLDSWDRYTATFTINMTIDEYDGHELYMMLPFSSLTNWGASGQLEDTFVDNMFNNLTHDKTSNATHLNFTVFTNFSASSLSYGTYQGKVVYLIPTGGAPGPAPVFIPAPAAPAASSGGGGGGAATIAIAEWIEMYPAYIVHSQYQSILPGSLLDMPTVVVENIDDSTHNFVWEFRDSQFDVEGEEVSAENSATSWCKVLDANNQEASLVFGLQPGAFKMIEIKCLVPDDAVIGETYVTSFCVSGENSESSACTLIQIPIQEVDVTSSATGFVVAATDSFTKLMDFGLVCFNGNDGNCLVTIPSDLSIGDFQVTKLPTVSVALGAILLIAGFLSNPWFYTGAAAMLVYNLLGLIL